MLHIHLLGDLRLTNGSVMVPRLATQKAVSLLGYLIMNAGRAHPREGLAEMLWPQRPRENARRSLHTGLWQIRRALKQAGLEPAEYVSATDSAIEWHSREWGAQAHYWLDVAEFDSAAAGVNPDRLRRAVELYRGDLLDGIYDDWCVEERYRLQDKFLQVLRRLTELCLDAARFADALDYAYRSLQTDNLREDAYRAAIVALYQLGQRTAALEQFAACMQVLKAELDIEPSLETRTLYQAVLHESLPRRTPAQALSSPSVSTEPLVLPAGAAPIPPERIPFASRVEELRQLTDWWQAGYEPLALVMGEAGVGKTRLTHEWCATANPRATICVGHCYAFERMLPYQALGEALREWIGGIPDIRLKALPDWVLAELARLLPDLSERLPGCVPSGGQDQARLFDAVARTLAQLAGESPVLFILEDFHWAAESTRALLEYLVRRIIGAHSRTSQRHLVRWVVTLRPEEPAGGELRLMVQRLRRDDLVREVPLSRLAERDVVDWIGAWSGLGDAARTFALQLYRETQGNAFFMTETVESLFAAGELRSEGKHWQGTMLDGAAPRLPFPRAARELIEARLAILPPQSADALGVAAVAGCEFDVKVLRAAWGRGEDETLNALDDLLRAQLVRESGSAAGRDYVFAHDKIQETTYAALPRAKRAALHRRVALAMEAEYGAAAATELVHHFQQAGEATRAFQWGIHAGEQALQLSAYQDALRCLTDAHEQLARIGSSVILLELELRLFAGLCNVYDDLRMASQLIPMAERLLERSQQARNKSYQVEALLRLGRGLNMANDPRAFAILAQARDLAAQTQDKHLPEILYRMGTCVGWLGDWPQALRLFAEAEAAGPRFGDRHTKVRNLIGTGVAQMFTGNFGASMDTYRQALVEAEAGGDQHALATVLGNLADNYLRLHLPKPSSELLHRAQAVWDGTGTVKLDCLQLTGWMYHQLGEHATAREWIEKAYRLARERNHMEQLREIYPTLCAVLLALGERNQALELAQEFYANPGAQYGADDYLPPFTRGGVWLALGRLPEAEADLLLAVQRWERTRIDAQLWEVLISLGQLRIAQGDLEAARAVYSRAREPIIQIAGSLDTLPDIRFEFLSAVLPLLELNG